MSLVGAIAKLRDAWPTQEFGDRTIKVYAEALAVYPGDAVEAAVTRLLTRCKFRPTIGEIAQEIAECELNLPTVEEAWEIATKGDLRSAHFAVTKAAEHVGGRYAILHTENATTLRAQFRRAYEGYRQRALADYREGVRPEVPGLRPGPTMAALPVTERFYPRPVVLRLTQRLSGRQLDPPTEEEKADAIAVLALGEDTEDTLYQEAERIFAEAAS